MLAALVTHLDRNTNRHSLARTPLAGCRFLSHIWWKFTPVRVGWGRDRFAIKCSSRRFTGGAGEETLWWLKRESSRHLNIARAAAAEEGVLGGHVGGDG